MSSDQLPHTALPPQPISIDSDDNDVVPPPVNSLVNYECDSSAESDSDAAPLTPGEGEDGETGGDDYKGEDRDDYKGEVEDAVKGEDGDGSDDDKEEDMDDSKGEDRDAYKGEDGDDRNSDDNKGEDMDESKGEDRDAYKGEDGDKGDHEEPRTHPPPNFDEDSMHSTASTTSTAADPALMQSLFGDQELSSSDESGDDDDGCEPRPKLTKLDMESVDHNAKSPTIVVTADKSTTEAEAMANFADALAELDADLDWSEAPTTSTSMTVDDVVRVTAGGRREEEEEKPVTVDEEKKESKEKIEPASTSARKVESAIAQESEEMQWARIKMQILLASFSRDQLERYTMYRRSALPKSAVRRLVTDIAGVQPPNTVVIAMAGIAKLFAGDLIEHAIEVRRQHNMTDKAITPTQLRDAFLRLQEKGGTYPIGGQKLKQPFL